jgi:hypothetical protein
MTHGTIGTVPRSGSIIASVAAWTLGAAVSVSVGLLALSAIGVGPTSSQAQQLPRAADRLEPPEASVTSPPTVVASPHPTVSGSASATFGTNHTIESVGGTVVARCGSGGAYLVFWTPSPGFRTTNVNRGPASQARLAFEGNGQEIQITVTCIGLNVHSSIENDSGP